LVTSGQGYFYQPLAGVGNPRGSGVGNHCYLLPFVKAGHHALGGSLFGMGIQTHQPYAVHPSVLQQPASSAGVFAGHHVGDR
jgi:hypothetical protein